MLDIVSGVAPWIEQNKIFATATVIKTWGSAPRLIGSTMAISKDMDILGSVSGGCIEGAVVKEAMSIMQTAQPKKLAFGVSDEDAWSVGLSCGGKIEVFVEPFMAFDTRKSEQNVWKELHTSIQQNKGCVLLTYMSGDNGAHQLVYPNGDSTGSIAEADLIPLALDAYKSRKNQIIAYKEESYFAQVFPRKSQLLIIGAAHISVDLVSLANQFGFETVIIDPRGIFARNMQFDTPPDQLFEKWPEEVLHNFELDEYAYAVLLTHDPKIDDQALHILLKSDIAYIGALGSRRTHSKRKNRLDAASFSEEEINRIHGPIGVDINAKLPKEIALSILAEIISIKNQYL